LFLIVARNKRNQVFGKKKGRRKNGCGVRKGCTVLEFGQWGVVIFGSLFNFFLFYFCQRKQSTRYIFTRALAITTASNVPRMAITSYTCVSGILFLHSLSLSSRESGERDAVVLIWGPKTLME